MKLKIDLHVHTTNSPDAYTHPSKLFSLCEQAGLDGLAVTDHNVLATTMPGKMILIPGMEISSRDGHVIGLGLPEPIPRGLSADETISQIREFGGLSIIPHPYDLFRSAVKPDKLMTRPDAIETINSASILHTITWKRARTFARDEKLPAVAGSDAHIPQTVGRAFTLIDAKSDDIPSILDAIRNGAVTPYGRSNRMGDRFHKMILHRYVTRLPSGRAKSSILQVSP